MIDPAERIDRPNYLEPLREEEVPVGSKPRIRVTNTLAVPYRWICQIEVSYRDPDVRYETRLAQGTGLLIGPRSVLTAAHVLSPRRGREKVDEVIVSPARDGSGPPPLGSFEAADCKLSPNWLKDHSAEYDFGLIRLAKDVSTHRLKTGRLGYWGDPQYGSGSNLRALAPAEVAGRTINVAGYPEDRSPRKTLWIGTGRISGHVPELGIREKDKLIRHAAPTSGGQSGAPVWLYHKSAGRRDLVGVHTTPVSRQGAEASAANLAIRLRPYVLDLLRSWM